MREIEDRGHSQFIFDPVGNTADRKLLGSVTLMGTADPRLENTEWLAYMRDCVEVGSRDTRQAGTVSIKETHQARRQFEYEISVRHPSHRLRSVYANPNSKVPLPGRLLDVVAALDDITGDGVGAISITSALARISSQHLYQRHNHIGRLASVLGWQGEVPALLAERPYLLLQSPAKWATLAQLAARHGTAEHKRFSVREVGKLMQYPLEYHLLAAVGDGEYTFGRLKLTRQPLAEVSQHIHQALADGPTAEKVGSTVIRTYRKYRPDKAVPTEAPVPQHVTGREGWLSAARTANKMEAPELAAKLNALIETGGQRLRGHKDETPTYTAIVDARLNLFQTLGLVRPRTKEYANFLGFLHSRPGLVNAKVVISVCQRLKANGVSNPLPVIRSCLQVLTRPDRIEDQLAAIREYGVQPAQALRYHPGLLGVDPDKIPSTLRTHNIAAKVVAEAKVVRMRTHPPKGLEAVKPPGEAFNPLRYKQDYQVLYLVTQDTTKLKDPDWLMQIMHYVSGVPKIRPQFADAAVLADIEHLKAGFAAEIGLTSPEHPLAAGYARRGKDGIVPQQLLSTVQTLQELTGNALGAIIQDKRLLSCSSARLLKSYRYIERLAAVLKWDGSVPLFVQRHPAALDVGHRQRMIAAQLAAKLGVRSDIKLDGASVMRILAAAPEAHLMELLQNPDYRFGDRLTTKELAKISVPAARQYIHKAIATPEGMARLGQRVARTYLRFCPLPAASK